MLPAPLYVGGGICEDQVLYLLVVYLGGMERSFGLCVCVCARARVRVGVRVVRGQVSDLGFRV